MVQNHLLQLLCLVAMEPPTYVDRETVRDEKLKVLQALQADRPAATSTATIVARPVRRPACVDGRGRRRRTARTAASDPDSATETFVAIRAEVQNWRWAGVPFYLRTGKRMDRRASEIVVQFKASPHPMFPGSEGVTEPNRLVIQLQPDEGMRLHMTAKEPGPGGIRLRPVSLDLSYADDLPAAPPRRLRAAAHGRRAAATRPCSCAATRSRPPGRGSSRSSSAGRAPTTPPAPYPAGTSGPSAATTLLERDGRSWHERHRPDEPTLAPRRRARSPRRIAERSARRAARPTSPRLDAAADRGPARGRLACANLAHGFAASGAADKQALRGARQAERRDRLGLQRHALGAPAVRALPARSSSRPSSAPAASRSSPAACPRCATASPRAATACSSRCSAAT